MITREHINQLSSFGLRSLSKPAKTERVAMIGNHVPRRCGIATFTTDLSSWLEHHGCQVEVFAMSDKPGSYDYPSRVRTEISAQDLESYREAAREINRANFDVVCVQHEYGIYGGECGEYLLTLLETVRAPIVTTLHTILDKPSDAQRRIMAGIVDRSARLVVMSQHGKKIMESIYPGSIGKIVVIPHGIPDASQVDRREARQKLELAGRKTILTFGLLSRDKGIDQMIRALEKVREYEPDVLYTIVGATHPHVVEFEGEVYRDSLEALVKELGLEANVRFVNEFVPLESVVEWLVACDVYVCPYLKVEQVTSGTLSYAYGLGKPVVSTPNWHAQELLADDRGKLVPTHNPEAMAEAVIEVLAALDRPRPKDPSLESMQWINVADTYVNTFQSSTDDHATSAFALPSWDEMPADHLSVLTDDVGILQHGQFNFPRRSEGYCTDDNARALILMLEAKGLLDEKVRARLESTYLAFVAHAYDADRAAFHNFMSYDRQWLDDVGSQDCQGRAIWALGTVAGRSLNQGHREFAIRWFGGNLALAESLDSPRAMAYALMGFAELAKVTWSAPIAEAVHSISQRFHKLFEQSKEASWPWWEPVLAYDNARLPQALLIAAQFLNSQEAKNGAIEALKWLCRIQTGADSSFAPIGSNGFYRKGSNRAWYDQQPIDATATVQACLAAFDETHDATWLFEARRAWDWFTGRNSVGLALAADGGGCYDGLSPDKVNLNQGAESTLCYLSAWISMNAARVTKDDVSSKTRFAV